jgi:hypothetical protein
LITYGRFVRTVICHKPDRIYGISLSKKESLLESKFVLQRTLASISVKITHCGATHDACFPSLSIIGKKNIKLKKKVEPKKNKIEIIFNKSRQDRYSDI